MYLGAQTFPTTQTINQHPPMIFFLFIPPILFFVFKAILHDRMMWPGFANATILDWGFMLFVGCFFSFLISLVPIGLSAWIGSMPEIVGVKDKTYNLIALRQQDGVKGRFFLGSGYIGDEQYYFWYRLNPDGSVSGGKTERQDGVRIYYGPEPTMTTFRTEYKSSMASKYLWIVGLDLRRKEDWWPDFKIPEGSIKEGFSL